MFRAGLILVLLVAGCTEPRSKTCRDVCAREAACRDEVETADNFDEGECLDACAALERDEISATSVEKHAECVRAAAEADNCAQLVDCP